MQLTGGDHADEVTDIPDVRFSDVKVINSGRKIGLCSLRWSHDLGSGFFRVLTRQRRSLKISLSSYGIQKSSSAWGLMCHAGFFSQVQFMSCSVDEHAMSICPM